MIKYARIFSFKTVGCSLLENNAVLLDIRDNIATITLNQTEKLNVLSIEIVEGLTNVFQHMTMKKV